MSERQRIVRGAVYVTGDNIDTDQIIPAKFLNLVPTIPNEYRRLGTHALSGLPETCPPFVDAATGVCPYVLLVAGRNFGCGSSREHAPIALRAAGIKAVVAESYARIFFRNAVAVGELYPLESQTRLCDVFRTGDAAELDLDAGVLTRMAGGERFELRPMGAVAPVVEAGGLFAYARKTGMVAGVTGADAGGATTGAEGRRQR
jgi:3-isopropylmalate/(R)-2-methylmalate dehydratase small subunit